MPTRPLVLAILVAAFFATAANVMANDAVDGTYTGERVLTHGDPRACMAKDAASITIQGNELRANNSQVKDFTMVFDPDPNGTFVVVAADIGGRVADMRGHVVNGVLDADVTNAHCVYHWHLEKQH